MLCVGTLPPDPYPLDALLEHVYRICASQVFATDSPLDPLGAEFFRRHPDRVRALRAEPLWQRPVAASVRVEATR